MTIHNQMPGGNGLAMPHFHRLSWSIVIGLGLCCLWVTVGLPQYWRHPLGDPLRGQPALVSDHAAFGVDGPAGFDQAQGSGQ